MPLGDLYASLTPAPYAVPISDGSSTLNAWVTNGSGGGGASWIPLVTGAEPVELVSDGAGHLILVAYTP